MSGKENNDFVYVWSVLGPLFFSIYINVKFICALTMCNYKNQSKKVI